MMLWCLEPALFGNEGWRNMRLLREGKAIEFEPGVSGRLNLKNKTLELSTGEILSAGHNSHLFPSTEAERISIEQIELFQSQHPITYGIQKFYEKNSFGIWLSLGSIVFLYGCWCLLKFLVRELFFTATKAMEDAKKDKNHICS